MARIQSGLDLSIDFNIVDVNLRSFSFNFQVQRAEDVEVLHEGVPLEANRYAVTLRVGGAGGSVRLLAAGEVSNPVVLTAGETVRVQRNTTVRRGAAFGSQGYAQAIASEAEASLNQQVLEELADRLISHATVLLSSTQLAEILRTTGISNIADGAVDFDALAMTLAQAIRNGIESGSLSLSGDDISWVSIGGQAEGFSLEGAVWANIPDWARRGNTDDIPSGKLDDRPGPTEQEVYDLIRTILTQGANITLTRDDGTRRINVAGQAAGGGSSSELDPLGALPAAGSHQVGDILNVLGRLYELVADTDEENILRGTAGADGIYRGATKIMGAATRGSFADPAYQGAFQWQPTSNAMSPFRARFPRAALTGPPATIYGQMVGQRGETTDFVLVRDAARDTTGTWAYASAVGDAVSDTPVGDTFRATFYSDAAHTTALSVHSVDRWEELADRTDHDNSAPTEQEVYDLAKRILQEGGHTTITFNDAARKIQINEDEVGTGTSLPTDPEVGDQFILLGTDTVATDPVRTVYQAQSTLRQVSLNGGTGGPEAIRFYTGRYSGPNSATRRLTAFLDFNGARAKTANRVWFYREGDTPRSFQVEANSRAGEPNRYVVTGLNAGVFIPGAYHINVGFTDGTKLNPDATVPQGHYIYKGGADGWIYAPGVAAPWATQGQPRPTTQLAVTELRQGNTTPGLSIINSSADARTGLHGFNPTFDLDDDDKQHGVVNFEATVRLSLPSVTTIGFDSDSTNPLREVRISAFAFANRLRAQSAYLDGVTSDIHGTVMGTVVVREGNATLGTATVYLAHDGNNVLGAALIYDGASSNRTFSLTVQDISAVFSHNDGPTAARNLTARGRKVAETTALPTAAIARGTLLSIGSGADATYTWDKLAAGYIAAGGIGNRITLLHPPANPPSDDVMGLQLRSKVGSTYRQTINLFWGGSPLSEEGQANDADFAQASLFFRGTLFGGGAAARVLVRYTIDANGSTNIHLVGDGTALPANSTIEVYELGAFAV